MQEEDSFSNWLAKANQAQRISYFMDLKSSLAEKEAALKEFKTEIRERQELIKRYIRRSLEESGAENVKTESGTAYIEDTVYINISDWQEALKHVIENNLWDFLTKKLSTTAIKEWESIQDQVFPGTRKTITADIKIRKPLKSKKRSES